MKAKKIYQILVKGIVTNKLILIDVYDENHYLKMIKDYRSGKYEYLLLLGTNVYEKN